jgi:endogenous inhibitor of DNA gyrase (YacG/DUF329 family)
MDDALTRPPARPCPICGKPAEPQFRPFCSARCRMVDLGRWLKGDYRVPTEEPPEDGEMPEREE